MFTGLIASILGLVSGLVPDLLKEVVTSRNHTREQDFLKLQHKLQMEVAQAQGDSRLREIEGNNFAEEMRATREYLSAIIEAQSKPTGIVWVDGFNAVLRPIAVVLIMALFMLTAVPFVWAVLGQMASGVITAKAMAEIIWGSLVGESILAVMGFLFGYRSAVKK
jgi:hypothetical protein